MRRAAALALTVLVLVGGLGALLLVFQSRDEAGLEGSATTGEPGERQPDRGAAHDADAPPAADLPTSGAHRPRKVTRDRTRIGGDELLHALELGNVVLAYDAAVPPPALVRLQDDVAGAFDAELAAAGQSVILARIGGVDGVAALAWRRLLRAPDAADPQLRAFAEAHLGVGARG